MTDEWLPIAQAPRDRRLMLYDPVVGIVTGAWSRYNGVFSWFAAGRRGFWLHPTHYCELPAKPVFNPKA